MNTDASYVVIHDRVISGYFATSGLSPSAVATGLPSGMAPWCRHVEGATQMAGADSGATPSIGIYDGEHHGCAAGDTDASRG
jgi:hypothetical protein